GARGGAVLAHGEEDVRWLGRSRRAGGAERDGDAGEVEEDEQALAARTRKPDVQRVREARPVGGAVPDDARDARAKPRPEAVDEGGRARRHLLACETRGDAEADD